MTRAEIKVWEGSKAVGNTVVICSERYADKFMDDYHNEEDYEVLAQIRTIFPSVTSFTVLGRY